MLQMKKYRPKTYYSKADKKLMWDRWSKGESLHSIARLFDRHHPSIQRTLAHTGGTRPPTRRRSPLVTVHPVRHEFFFCFTISRMSINAISFKSISRKRNLSLNGLSAGLAVAAFSNSANAAVEGSAETENIAASGLDQTRTISIDIDGDGNTEFDLVGFINSNVSEVYVKVVPIESGAKVVGSGSQFYADKLAADASIDAGSTFTASNPNLAWSESKGDFGNWVPVTQRGYVGVSFDFEGNTHYGSLDVEVSAFSAMFNNPASEFDATLHGYVWETTSGNAILAGATPSEPVPAAVPIDYFSVSLILIASVCLMAMRRLRQTPV
jgi:hypothetical protein